MYKLKGIWENFKSGINEKKEAIWLKFRAKLPVKIQEFLDDFEPKYNEYKKSSLCDIIETIVFVLVMVIIIRFFVAEIRWIPTGSMNPTLIEGDRIIVERYSRFFHGPQRGDIMVFYPPSTKLSKSPIPLLSRLTGIFCKDIAYIKRVIGLPGDKIEIKFEDDGSAYVYVNDEKLQEPYIKSIYDYIPCVKNDEANQFMLMNDSVAKCGPFILPDDSYFMMGDNRGNSLDSRYWGILTRDRFVGRAVFVARFFGIKHQNYDK